MCDTRRAGVQSRAAGRQASLRVGRRTLGLQLDLTGRTGNTIGMIRQVHAGQGTDQQHVRNKMSGYKGAGACPYSVMAVRSLLTHDDVVMSLLTLRRYVLGLSLY